MPIFGGINVDKLKSKDDVNGLIKAIDHKEDHIAIAAMGALTDIKPNQAVEPIQAQLGNSSKERRLAAANRGVRNRRGRHAGAGAGAENG